MVAGQADDDQDGMDIERAKALVEPFMRPNPALARLIQAIKQTPEPRELTGRADTPGQSDQKRGRAGSSSTSPDDESMRLSREAIYKALYIQAAARSTAR